MSRFEYALPSVGTLLTRLQFGAPTKAKDHRMQSNDGKMEKSFLNFKVCSLPDSTSRRWLT